MNYSLFAIAITIIVILVIGSLMEDE